MGMNRRTFLRVSALSAAGVFLPIRVGTAASDDTSGASGGSLPKELVREGVTPSRWITPNDEFYVQDITGGNWPTIDESKWKLIVSGLVRQAKLMRYADILALAEERGVTVHRTLTCIGDPIGGDQIGNAEWGGIPLRWVLEAAQPREQATRVVFRCQDGYHTAIPIEDAMDPDTILAFKMNGEPLPRAHGFPVRLLNPGKYGQKCPKWIINMELVAKEYLGYWETRGWSDVAAVKLATRIHFPTRDAKLPAGTYRISGSAFDGGNGGGIAAVQVSTDGGETWHDAEIWAPGDGLTWSLWQYEWTVSRETGWVRLLARSINKRGDVQTDRPSDPHPAGAEGYHTVEVQIIGA